MKLTIALNENINNFITELRKSLADSTFVKLTLSNYKGAEESLQRISVRPIETKKGEGLAFQLRYARRDVFKNFTHEEAAAKVRSYLENGFRSGHLFTTRGDFQLTVGKKNSRLITGKPTFAKASETVHDRKKKHLIDQNAYYLKALGITTELQKPARQQGRNEQVGHAVIRSDQRDKWKQINKFVEILAGLIENSPLKDKTNLRIVDMGSGKGYLTFAVYDYLLAILGPKSKVQSPKSTDADDFGPWTLDVGLEVIGVEQRRELVDLCNDIAETSNFDGLSFIHGTIADFDVDDVDILIALHACDTATDDALYKGIKAEAAIIVAAPCCHKEIKKQMKPTGVLAPVLKHPVMLERTAETITDGIRSMLLEREGYKTKMFEFVRDEHTPKNNLIVATKRTHPTNRGTIDTQIEEIQNTFGIARQHLADTLERRR